MVGPRAERLRVALVTQERKIVKRWRSLRRRHFLVVEDYDPRIHVLFSVRNYTNTIVTTSSCRWRRRR